MPLDLSAHGYCQQARNAPLFRFHERRADLLRPSNTDRGTPFTSWAWTDLLRKAGVKVSMGGKGCLLNNFFVEMLWRFLKYECIYLHA
jgi:putative transposase